MAFDAASSGGGRDRRSKAGVTASSGAEESLLATLSQRVWNLVQTISIIDKCVEQVGTGADTTSLRQRLQAAEAKAEGFRVELDAGLRKLRVDAIEKGDAYTTKSTERLAEQYAEVRKKLSDSMRASQLRQRQTVPSTDEPAPAEAPRSKQREERGGRGVELQSINVHALDDVDEAIAEVGGSLNHMPIGTVGGGGACQPDGGVLRSLS